MNKRVYNKTFGKIVRTLGFLLILISSVFLAVQLILTYNTLPFISTIEPYAIMVNDILASQGSIATIISEYALIGVIVGQIMILWAIRRGLILRVILTVTFVFLFVENSIAGESVLVPIMVDSPAWVAGVLDLVRQPFEQLVALSEYIIPGVTVAVPFLLWVVYAYKKPGRLSIFMLRLGALTLFLSILALIVTELFVPSLADIEIVGTIVTVLYILTYLLNALGGVFGVLGFARK
jgi:hypothetical protein